MDNEDELEGEFGLEFPNSKKKMNLPYYTAEDVYKTKTVKKGKA